MLLAKVRYYNYSNLTTSGNVPFKVLMLSFMGLLPKMSLCASFQARGMTV